MLALLGCEDARDVASQDGVWMEVCGDEGLGGGVLAVGGWRKGKGEGEGENERTGRVWKVRGEMGRIMGHIGLRQT